MKHQIDTTVGAVVPGSLAEEAGIMPGDKLLSINGQDFRDILEYRFLVSECEVTLEVEKCDGFIEKIEIASDYEDLGIEFREGLIDQAQSCTNKCIFCFIDQLPPNMRETVYFKDDDTRLSFLQGNYVTLTNMNDDDLDRLIRMRVSPINISVHTTNPKLRERMLHNRFAGRCMKIMQRFAASEICMNCQIVLCPGINDGEELTRTLRDLASLSPYVNSISVVPVGLTRYRDCLYPLTEFDGDGCRRVVSQVEALQKEFSDRLGTRLVYLSDEFYLNAGLAIPSPEDYEGFPQIENGVGLIAAMDEEFTAAATHLQANSWKRTVSIATGELAADFIRGLADRLTEQLSGLSVTVYAVRNNFFGGGVNVAGLVCGGDIIDQLKGKELGETLFIPHSMLRDDDELFLDDTTLTQVSQALGVPVEPVYNDGWEFVEKITGQELSF